MKCLQKKILSTTTSEEKKVFVRGETSMFLRIAQASTKISVGPSEAISISISFSLGLSVT